MQRTLALAALLSAVGAALAPVPPSTPCTLTLTPDAVRGAQFHARLSLAGSCGHGASFRVRKSSTLNVRRQGAPYQPIKPITGAWTVTPRGSNIPPAELWTLITWRWERFYPDEYNVRTREYGVWHRIPVGGGP